MTTLNLTTNTHRFGIEIETIGQTRDTIARAIQSVIGGQIYAIGSEWHAKQDDGRVWKVVHDASLTNVAPERRAEVVSPILTYADMDKLQEIVRAIRKAGAKVDEQCGIHVHIDATDMTATQIVNLTKIVYKQEEIIIMALGIQQTRMERYTKPIDPTFIAKIENQKPKTKDDLNILWYGYHNINPQRYDTTRYHGLNLNAVWVKNTIEFRWFEGSLHAGQVKAYVQLCLALGAKAMNAKATSSQRRMYDAQSAKYDFRVFLLGIGMIGEEFATARLHLLAKLPGDGAFKRGRQ